MKIAVLKECRPNENRVAATPETVRKLVKLGVEVMIEKGAGEASSILDSAYKEAGATIDGSWTSLIGAADIILKVQSPTSGEDGRDEISGMKSGAVLIGLLAPLERRGAVEAYATKGVTAFSLELLPRVTRAQAMDVLSSQSNLAGYRAVIDAAYEYFRAFPMMMTAAGTVLPAKVLVLGAGVAGLQAIATAKRLGAVVSAFDVRAAVKEQVESLGASFVEVEAGDETGETAGGYAKEMSEDYKARQTATIHQTIKSQDIVICTALIPGKKAPLLVSEAMLADMKPGSVIIDLAVAQGGNCAFSEEGKVVEKHNVKIVGHANYPSRLAANASELYARNILNFVKLLVDPESGKLSINTEDELISGTMLTQNGNVVHPLLKEKGAGIASGQSS